MLNILNKLKFKKQILVLLALSLLTSLTSQALSKTTNIEDGVFVMDTGKIHFSTFKKQKDLTIDHVGKDGYEVYGPKGLTKWVKSLGLDYIDLNTKLKYGYFDEYPKPEAIIEKIKQLESQYPNIIKTFSIGKSVKGRDLIVAKISDNVATDEVEPEFKYIANMHGNEIVGRELLVLFLAELADRYTKGDSDVIDLINNTEIYIMPTMNPDGSASQSRGNSKYVDLNRDFPDFTTSDNQNTFDGRAPETIAIMQFQDSRNFALSANFHDGAVVVNYPWDTSSKTFPMDNLIVALSSEYANANPTMVGGEFDKGITNGYDWYEVDGGMQDWSYFWHNDLQVTLELSNTKWPSYKEIPKQYNYNKESMYQYLKRIHQGAGFKINDPTFENGKVKISRINPNGSVVDIGTFGYKHGEFYKVLEEGKYLFEVTNANQKIVTFDKDVVFDFSKENGNYLHIDTISDSSTPAFE